MSPRTEKHSENDSGSVGARTYPLESEVTGKPFQKKSSTGEGGGPTRKTGKDLQGRERSVKEGVCEEGRSILS